MTTLAELVRLKVKLHELMVKDSLTISARMSDILAQEAQERAVPSPTPTPSSSPKPTSLMSTSQPLPLLTPVVVPRSTADTLAGEEYLDSVQAHVTSVGSSRGSVSSAILLFENMTLGTKAADPAARSPSSPLPFPHAGTPPRGGAASTIAPRRRLAFMANKGERAAEEQPLEPSAGVKTARA